MKKKTIDEWQGCYPSNWKGLITEDAYKHPAKFSNKLIRRIYDHIVMEGWVEPGDTIVDPFGGVALGALDAMRCGLNWRGVELEERFVEWGNRNIVLWNKKFASMPKWSGDAMLLQGDSRLLSQVLGQAHTAVNLPPYAETNVTEDRIFRSAKDPSAGDARAVRKGYEAQAVISSPPYAEQQTGGGIADAMRGESDYPLTNDGLVRAAKAGNAARVIGYQGSVSSPPFSDVLSRDKVSASDLRSLADEKGIANTEHISPIDMEKVGKRTQEAYGAVVSSPPWDGGEPAVVESRTRETSSSKDHGGPGPQYEKYGTQHAQLGSMKATKEGFDAAVSSPPFQATTGGTNVTNVHGPLADPALFARHAAGNMNVGYGETDGNLGGADPDDFWTSARTIVEQVYEVLVPGAHAVWVLKDYVKGGQRVPFCAQWQQMCESVGFVTLHEHHAMLVRNKGVSTTDMDGKRVSHEVSSKSFFRRIAEKKGSPPIDFEVVLCMVKK